MKIWRLIPATLLVTLAFVSPAAGATKVYLRTSTISGINGYSDGLPNAGSSLQTSVTNTAASGTDIQVTDTAGGTVLKFITPPLVSGVTISGSATCNLWGKESNTAANASFRCRFYKYSGGSEGSSLWTAQDARELTASITNESFSATPTSTAFSTGDRIVIKVFLENCSASSGCPTGTMAGSRTVTLDYNAGSGGADGDTYVSFTEALNFQQVGNISQSETNTVTVARGINYKVSQSETNTVTVARSRGQSVGISQSETSTPSVARVLGKNVSVTQGLTLSPSVCWDMSSPLSQALSFSVSATGIRSGGSNFDRGVTQAETSAPSVAYTVGRTVGVSQSLTASPSVARVWGRGVSVAQGFTAVQSICTDTGRPSSQGATFSVSATAAKGKLVAVSQSLTLSASATAGTPKTRGATQTLNAACSLCTDLGHPLGPQTASFTPSVTAAITGKGVIVTQSLTLTPSVARAPGKAGSVSQGATFAVTCTACPGHDFSDQGVTLSVTVATQRQMHIAATQALTLSPTVAAHKQVARAVSQSLSDSVTVARLAEFHKSVTQTLSFSPVTVNATFGGGAHTIAIAQSLTFGVTALTRFDFTRSATTGLAAADSVARRLDAQRTATASLANSVTASPQRAMHGTASQNLSLIASVAARGAFQRSATALLTADAAAARMFAGHEASTAATSFSVAVSVQSGKERAVVQAMAMGVYVTAVVNAPTQRRLLIVSGG